MSRPSDGDDQDWLDLMAGRAVPEADARTRQEAAWLRAALLNYREAAPPGGPAPAHERAARLLARARGAGVLPRPRVQAANGWRYALVACVAGLFVAYPLYRQGAGEATPPVAGEWRGAPVQRIEAADPVQGRDQMLQALRAEGFEAQRFERLGRPGIDLVLPAELPPAQAAVLTRLGLAPPPGPSLQIEFITASRPAPP